MEDSAETNDAENLSIRSDLSDATKDRISELTEKNPQFAERIKIWKEFLEKMSPDNAASMMALMEHQAHQDTLTGLLSQNGFFHHANEALSLRREQLETGIRQLTEGRSVRILYGDVDGLKKTNDELGREFGDALLTQIAQAIKNGSKPGDIVARYGPDEFVVLCIDATPDDVIERFNEINTDLVLLRENNSIPQWSGITFGATVLKEDGDLKEALMEADRKMKLAKNEKIQKPGESGGHIEGLQDL